MFLIEIIALVFLCGKNGRLALQKGLKAGIWKFYTVIAWLIAEFIGCVAGFLIFIKKPVTDIKQIAQSDMVAMSLVALFAAFGGYLLVRYILESKSDIYDNSVNEIGVDDLAPPKK